MPAKPLAARGHPCPGRRSGGRLQRCFATRSKCNSDGEAPPAPAASQHGPADRRGRAHVGGTPARDGRRHRHLPACRWRGAGARARLLRRRRRPVRAPGLRAVDDRSLLDAGRRALARVLARCERRSDSCDAELPQLGSKVARRASRRRPRGPHDVGARRAAQRRLWSRAPRSGGVAVAAGWPAGSRRPIPPIRTACTAPSDLLRGVPHVPLLRPRCCGGSSNRSRRRGGGGAVALVRRPAHVRQRAALRGADPRRRAARRRCHCAARDSPRSTGSTRSAPIRRACIGSPAIAGLGEGDRIADSGDEQPLEALGLIEAHVAALHVTGDGAHAAAASRCLSWFLGANVLATVLADCSTGACCDGLGAGAELELRRRVDARVPSRGARASQDGRRARFVRLPL